MADMEEAVGLTCIKYMECLAELTCYIYSRIPKLVEEGRLGMADMEEAVGLTCLKYMECLAELTCDIFSKGS